MSLAAGVKRAAPPLQDSIAQPTKRRRVRHSLRHLQVRPRDVESAPQDPVFTQGQLLRSIASALVLVGFDSVKPSALEMFRSHVEEYMLRFLSHIRSSMQNGRRTIPTPQDFISALSQSPNTAAASLLRSQLDLNLPSSISNPTIDAPDAAPPPATDLTALLEPLISDKSPSYIPKHFPPLPPQHAWISTSVFAARETDARKMREMATEEGTLAEQALRRLAAAAKFGAAKLEKSRGPVLSGVGRSRDAAGSRRARSRIREDAFMGALQEIEGFDDVNGIGGLDGAADDQEGYSRAGISSGFLVNHDMGHWRRGVARNVF